MGMSGQYRELYHNCRFTNHNVLTDNYQIHIFSDATEPLLSSLNI